EEMADRLRPMPALTCATLLQHVMPHHQNVHLRPEEAVERLLREVHDRLVFVERGVQEHRRAGLLLEGLEELPIERIGPAAHRLEPPAAIYVRHGRDDAALLR